MRIFTCTPVAFGGGPGFFARDSGLLSRGLEAIGVESRAVMPGERGPDDEAGLIRTAYCNLASAAWWSAQHVDGVVLYAWGSPRFRKVAQAIRDAGVFLILNQDSSGLVGPLVDGRDWLRQQWLLNGQGRTWKSRLAYLSDIALGLSIRLLLSEPGRARHLRCGDLITGVSPLAVDRYRRLCRIYGGEALAARVRLLPHPVEDRFAYDGRAKRCQVACVGRWDDVKQKRPWLLMEVVERLMRRDAEVEVVIVGEPTAEMRQWHRGLRTDDRERVQLRGRCGRDALRAVLLDSRVFFSPSAYESFGIAAAEALCGGCSVVAGRLVAMPAFEWFTADGCGRLAASDDADGHSAALLEELAAWRQGGRDAAAIAARWAGLVHAPQVAARVRGWVAARPITAL